MNDRQKPPDEGPRKRTRAKPPLPLTREQKKEIKRLHGQGFGTREIAKMVGVGRKRVRSVVPSRQVSTPAGPEAASPTTKVEPFKDIIQQKIDAGLTTLRILREIKKQGYTGSRTILGDYIRGVRGPLAPRKQRVKRRFETGPGEEIQIDWSTYQVPIAGKVRTVHAFAATLAFSRKAFFRFFFNQRESTLLEAHVLAFSDFGGVAKRIVYDNMATVVLGTIGRNRKPIWHPRFLDFSRHYGYEPFLCKVRDPDRKGGVENVIGYLERDFVRGSEFASLHEMNVTLRRWLDDVANCRVHGTTQRIPDEAHLEEKPFLIELPQTLFPVFEQEIRQVDQDATISVRGTRYTIPAHLAPGKVMVRFYAEHFEVLDPKGEVAMTRMYVPLAEKGRLVIDPSHYEGVRPRSPWPGGSIARMEDRFLERFPDLAELLTGVKVRMKTLFHVHLRELWRMSEAWGEQLFLQAALRAQAFRRFDAMAIKRILERNHPLPDPDPISPLGTEARLLCELGDVDGGSFDDYAYLDGDQPDQDNQDDSGPDDGDCLPSCVLA